MSEILAAILGAVFGAFVAGYLNFLAQRRAQEVADKKTLTIRLYEEWQDFDMLTARIIAYRVMVEFNEDSWNQLSLRLRTANRDEDWVAVSRVVHHFELLGALLTENRLDKPAFTRLFERYVRYWLRDGGIENLMNRSEVADGPPEAGWVALVRCLSRHFQVE